MIVDDYEAIADQHDRLFGASVTKSICDAAAELEAELEAELVHFCSVLYYDDEIELLQQAWLDCYLDEESNA